PVRISTMAGLVISELVRDRRWVWSLLHRSLGIRVAALAEGTCLMRSSRRRAGRLGVLLTYDLLHAVTAANEHAVAVAAVNRLPAHSVCKFTGFAVPQFTPHSPFAMKHRSS